MSLDTTKLGEQITDKTTAPLTEAAACASRVDPEFVDFVGLRQLFGIKRSLAYQLMANGEIKSVSLRRRGTVRGKRLFSVDSCRQFLRHRMEAGE